MKRIICLLTIFIFLASAAYAQQATQPVGERSAKSAEASKPLILTKDQVERLADAEKTRQLARAQLIAAQAQVEKIDAQIDGLIKEFQIELRLDPQQYERDLRVIDQQRNTFGFFPKPEPKKAASLEPKK